MTQGCVPTTCLGSYPTHSFESLDTMSHLAGPGKAMLLTAFAPSTLPNAPLSLCPFLPSCLA